MHNPEETRHHARSSLFRTLGWVAVAGMLGLAFVGPGVGTASATKPDEHKVTICHATDSDHNPYIEETVDIASSGLLQGGHNGHLGPIWQSGDQGLHIKWGDIIPIYTYVKDDGSVFVYPGLNWPAGASWLWNHCVAQTTTTTTTTTTTPTTTTTETTTTPTTTTETTTTTTTATTETTTTTTATTTTTTTTATTTVTPTTPTAPPIPSFPTVVSPPPTGSVLPATSSPSPTTSGEVAGVTSRPHTTPPPTSSDGAPGSPSDAGWQLGLLVLAAFLASVLVLTPLEARRLR